LELSLPIFGSKSRSTSASKAMTPELHKVIVALLSAAIGMFADGKHPLLVV
jgi:hypothetical protein